jgi:hypothetical protein
VNVRVVRGLELFERGRVVQDADGFTVFSMNSGEKYCVTVQPRATYTFPDFELRQDECKHVVAVRLFLSQADRPTEQPETLTPPFKFPRPSYAQDWPNYNAAQVNEKEHFLAFLADLCRDIPEPERPKGRGRPPIPLADAVFCIVFKAYSGFSSRRFSTDLRDATDRGYISWCPHFNSVLNCLENKAVTPTLRNLITATSLPLKAVETKFAVDSSGFTIHRYTPWYNLKYGRMEHHTEWQKIHLMCGVSTHVVTAAEIEGKTAHDSPMLPPLAKATAKNFKIEELSGDKAYLGESNLQTVADLGGVAYIPFKINTTGRGSHLWEKMYAHFLVRKDDFLKRYHLRSNVESVFSMVKRKFGDFLRSKTDPAMVNEIYCKLVAHNLCCVIAAMYELGIDPVFCAEPAPAQILKFPGA